MPGLGGGALMPPTPAGGAASCGRTLAAGIGRAPSAGVASGGRATAAGNAIGMAAPVGKFALYIGSLACRRGCKTWYPVAGFRLNPALNPGSGRPVGVAAAPCCMYCPYCPCMLGGLCSAGSTPARAADVGAARKASGPEPRGGMPAAT
eukprot:168350-Chlamydomonas_euryale.AAC.6